MSGRPNLPRSAAGPNSPWLIAVIVSIATFMEVLDTTIANVALRHIAGSLAASQDESTYIVTSYLVSNAIVLPISGWLSNVIGRKRFYMICVALFTFSSVMCGFSTSLGEILFFRVLQGIGGGGLAPTEQSIFADSFTPQQRALAFSLYGFTVVTAPAVGPVLGGWLTDHYSWHWVFLINLPVGLISLVLVWLFVHDSPLLIKERAERLRRGLKVDYIGFLLVAIGFGCLQIVLDRFERDDGFSSTFITTLSIAAVVALVALVVWELWTDQPVVNLRLLRSLPFTISNIVMFAFGFLIVATTQLLPQFSQELLGYDALTAGMTLGLGGFVSLFMMPLAGIITGRLIQPKWLILSALIGTAGAMHYAAGLNLNAAFWNLSEARMLQVIWLPLVFIPLSAVQFNGVPPDKNADASAIINLMRNLGGSVGVSVVTTEPQWRTQFHHARLAEHVTPYDGFPLGSALQQIAQQVQTQATMLSYLDVFTILAFVALAAAPLVFFLPNVPKGLPLVGTRFGLSAALLLAGCTVGPNFESPSPWSPLSWFRTTRTEKATGAVSLPVAEPVDVEWWRVLHDPELTSLMRRVAGSNLDVRAAEFRLAEARAQRGVTAAAQYPMVNGNGSYTRELPSKQGVISLISGGGASQATQANGLGGTSGGIPNSSSVGAFDLFQAGFDASWELDLWGRVRRQVENADAQVDASLEARRNTLLTSLAELARNYVQLRGLQDSERIVRSNLATAQQSVRLTDERVRGGLATDLDLANARAQAEATAANLPQLEAQQLQAINAISLLLGEAPGAVAAELDTPKPVPPVPPQVPIGLPSELARRRPDIRQAEAQLHAAVATIGAAQADFYPSVTLSGSVALQATQFTRVFDVNALTYGVGPSITIPIFEGGRLRRTLELRNEQAKEAAINYQKTVLQAFHDVDNALIAYRTDQLRRERLAAQAAQSRRALGIASDRYRNGLSDFLEVLTAERTLLQAEQDLATATTTVSTDLIMLYKALGGGWQIGEGRG